MVERTSEYGWHRFRPKRRWFGRDVYTEKGSMSELFHKVPHFSREPCAVVGEGNPYLDMIIRDCLPDTHQQQIPVATVSKKYKLIQHHELFDVLGGVLLSKGLEPNSLASELCLTEFGERMWLSVTLPAYSFDSPTSTRFHPGDTHDMNLTVNVLNSVDKTTPLEINLLWYRLVCSNGMVCGKNFKIKLKHKPSTVYIADEIGKFLQSQLKQVDKQQQQLRFWFEKPVCIQNLTEARPEAVPIEQWLEKSVSNKWGIYAAARAYHIAKTGCDGKFINKKKKQGTLYHELTLDPRSVTEVPGAFSPARNAYDISQVLSWIASQQGSIQTQFKKMVEIQVLMRALLRQKTITLRG